jgi:putative acetyltransferase
VERDANMTEPADPSAVTIEPADPAGETAQKLINELCQELSGRYGVAPSPFSPSEAQMPRTIFLIARNGSQPVGCAAIRQIDDNTAEVKRMYVAVGARRLGIGRRVLAELERFANEFGYRILRLETGNRQPEAIALYENHGFHRIPPFGRYVGNPVSVCFEKQIETVT